MPDKSMIIIGAGFAGLSAGIYARLNGYQAHIFELHDKPGGLCTSWKRKGYTIDGCIHWLVGSNPKSGMNQYWQEVGLAQNREFVDAEEYARYEAADGRTIIFYCNTDSLEAHLLKMFPGDEKAIRELISGIRMGTRMSAFMDSPSGSQNVFKKIQRGLSAGWFFLVNGRKLNYWMKTTTEEYLPKIKDPVLRDAFRELWMPDFPLFFMLFTFSYLNNQNAGYPIGGSLPMSEALEKRFLALGGQITYKARVEKILVENGRAVGIRLADGNEHRAGRVISAADGHTTIYEMLEGKYKDESIDKMYREWKPFPPLLYVGIGVKRSFAEVPVTVSGFSTPLRHAIDIGGTYCGTPPHSYLQPGSLPWRQKERPASW